MLDCVDGEDSGWCVSSSSVVVVIGSSSSSSVETRRRRLRLIPGYLRSRVRMTNSRIRCLISSVSGMPFISPIFACLPQCANPLIADLVHCVFVCLPWWLHRTATSDIV